MMKRLLSLAVFFRRNVEIVANFHHLRRNRCLGVYFMTVYKELIKECDKLEEGVKRGLAGLEFVEVLEGEGKILGLELGETLLPGILSVLL